VASGNYIDEPFSVRNAIYHSPRAHTDAPEVARTLQFCDSRWTGVRHQHLNLLENAPGDLRIKILKFFAR